MIPERPKIWLWSALPLLLALLVHGQSLWNGFIADDPFLILTNPQITGDGPLRELLLTDWFNRGGVEAIGYYRPAVKASLRLDYLRAGPDASAFHLTNLSFHGALSVALVFLLRRFVSLPVAALAASLFAVHPGTVQAVAIITARSDVMAACFGVLAVVCHARWRETGRRSALAGSLLFVALALGSKEASALLPLGLFAWGLATREAPKAALRAALPSLGVLGAYAALRAHLAITPYTNALGTLEPLERVAAMLTALGSYVPPLLYGEEVVILPKRAGFLAPPVFVALLLALGFAAWWWRSRGVGAASFGLVWIAMGLGPVLAVWLVHIPASPADVPIAERWVYGPAVGLACVAAQLLERARARVRYAAALPLVLAFAAISFGRGDVYRSNDAYSAYAGELYLAATEEELSERERYLRELHAGTVAASAGALPEAFAAFERAQKLAPFLPEAYLHGYQLADRHDLAPQMIAPLERLLSPGFRDDEAAKAERRRFGSDGFYRLDRSALFRTLGRGYALKGDYANAEGALKRAVSLAKTPEELAAAELLLGAVLEERGQLDDARAAYDRSMAANPKLPDPVRKAARLEEKRGRADEARRLLERLGASP